MDLEEILAQLENLTELSDEDLTALDEAIAAAYDELRPVAATEEERQALRDLVEARREVAAESTSRATAAAEAEAAEAAAAAELDAEMAALDAEMAAAAGTDDGETEPEAEPPAPEGPAPELEPVSAAAAPSRPARPVSRRAGLAALAEAQPRQERAGAGFGRALTVMTDVPGFVAGARVENAEAFGRALYERQQSLASVPLPTQGKTFYPVFTAKLSIPPAHTIRDVHNPGEVQAVFEAAVAEHTARIESNLALMDLNSQEPLLGSGGPCAPAPLDFGIEVVGGAQTPFTNTFATVGFPRSRVRFFQPICFNRWVAVRTLTDAVVEDESDILTSPSGAFTSADLYRYLQGPPSIDANARIIAIIDSTHVQMSADATDDAGPITVVIAGRSGNTGRRITEAEDTAGYVSQGGTTLDKAAEHIDCPPDPVECSLGMVVDARTIGNWVDRAFPEYVRAWQQYMDINYAVGWEETHLADYMNIAQTAGNGGLLTTGAPLYGAFRDTLRRVMAIAEYARSCRRLTTNTRFHVATPTWFTALLKMDLAMSFAGSDAGTGGFAQFRVTDAQLVSWLSQYGLNFSTYEDDAGYTANGVAQILGCLPTSGGSVPELPTEARVLMWQEGSIVRGDGGELRLGVYRDSALNRVNDFQSFEERWSKLCFRGCGSSVFAADLQLTPNGAASGTITPPTSPTP